MQLCIQFRRSLYEYGLRPSYCGDEQHEGGLAVHHLYLYALPVSLSTLTFFGEKHTYELCWTFIALVRAPPSLVAAAYTAAAIRTEGGSAGELLRDLPFALTQASLVLYSHKPPL